MTHAAWRKSSRSGANGACVESAELKGVAVVRDSKRSKGAVLTFDEKEWRVFLGMLKSGHLTRGG
ncbi:DUF397 domain-containing protein [Sphaerisporangium krabiense]|uniref:DUF397 domain-containing protein n=1 Tax=Sphaerisporangium krabiense TaxID=763782 RepID=UPI001C852062|nr:DUF397 domain-containing protein [Sphaerisporangium krabiense]